MWMLRSKPLYGKQHGAVVGYNTTKPGGPSHVYHSFCPKLKRLLANRAVLGPQSRNDKSMARKRGLDFNQATMVERKVPAYNRLKTDCVALRSVWLRTRMAGGVGAGGVNAPRYPICVITDRMNSGAKSAPFGQDNVWPSSLNSLK